MYTTRGKKYIYSVNFANELIQKKIIVVLKLVVIQQVISFIGYSIMTKFKLIMIIKQKIKIKQRNKY